MSKPPLYSIKLSMLLTEAIAKRLAEQLDKVASRWDIRPEYLGRFINAVTENIDYQSWVLRRPLSGDHGLDLLNFLLIYKIRNQASLGLDLLAILCEVLEHSGDYKNYSGLRRLVAIANYCGGRVI